MPRALAALLLLLAAALPAAAQSNPGHYQGFGDAGGFLNIVPPGQDGVLNGPEAIAAQGVTYPPHVKDQLDMYANLVYAVPGLTEDQLLDFYKDASFGVRDDDIDRVYSPTANVTVIRDLRFGVPHIFGDTRYATMFAEGYTGAEEFGEAGTGEASGGDHKERPGLRGRGPPRPHGRGTPRC